MIGMQALGPVFRLGAERDATIAALCLQRVNGDKTMEDPILALVEDRDHVSFAEIHRLIPDRGIRCAPPVGLPR